MCRGDGAGFKHRLSMVRWWAKESMSSVTFNIFIITTASARRQEEHTYLFYIVRRSLNFAKEEIFAQESESCLTTRIELLLHGNLARIVEEKKKALKHLQTRQRRAEQRSTNLITLNGLSSFPIIKTRWLLSLWHIGCSSHASVEKLPLKQMNIIVFEIQQKIAC